MCVCVVVCWGGGGGGGDNKWRQTWTSISVITRRAEQRQWQTSAWGPSIYETGHASNRKTPHTVMARGNAHRQLITALNFDASPRAGEKIYIIPLFLHRWWDTGCVCVGVCVCWCGGMLYLCELKGILHIHTKEYTVSADYIYTLVYLLNYYNSLFPPERCALWGHGQLIGVWASVSWSIPYTSL